MFHRASLATKTVWVAWDVSASLVNFVSPTQTLKFKCDLIYWDLTSLTYIQSHISQAQNHQWQYFCKTSLGNDNDTACSQARKLVCASKTLLKLCQEKLWQRRKNKLLMIKDSHLANLKSSGHATLWLELALDSTSLAYTYMIIPSNCRLTQTCSETSSDSSTSTSRAFKFFKRANPGNRKVLAGSKFSIWSTRSGLLWSSSNSSAVSRPCSSPLNTTLYPTAYIVVARCLIGARGLGMHRTQRSRYA